MKKPAFRLMGGLIATLAACACASEGARPLAVEPLQGPATAEIITDYTPALRCVADHARQQSYPAPRIAVGHITDMTGANDYYIGRRVTQGATLMAITAVSDAGMRLIERYDMGVLQVDMDYARSGLIKDSETVLRPVAQGQIQGADLYIVGGITEFNPNIKSSGIDAYAGGDSTKSAALAVSAGSYTIDVGIDLRLVDVRTSEVLSVRSFRKQIIGKELEAGALAMLTGGVVDIGAGERALEPVQTAVRTMIDRAVFEFAASLYSMPVEQCMQGEGMSVDGLVERGANAQVLEAVPAVATPPAPAVQPTRHEIGLRGRI